MLHRRIGGRDDGLGLEAVIGLLDLVFFWQRLAELAERTLVDESKMRVVEGVLHQAERARIPHFIKLRDAPEARIVFLDGIENGRQGLVERHPGIAVARIAVVGRRREIRHLLLYRKLRDMDELPGAIVGPAVVPANDLAVLAPAFGQLGCAMAAAILQGRRFTVGAEKQHDVLAEEAKGFWPGSEIIQRHHRIPKSAQNFLFRRQHVVLQSCFDGFFKFPVRPRCRATIRAPASKVPR